MFIALSLDTLGLPPERQAAVAKIQSESLRQDGAGARRRADCPHRAGRRRGRRRDRQGRIDAAVARAREHVGAGARGDGGRAEPAPRRAHAVRERRRWSTRSGRTGPSSGRPTPKGGPRHLPDLAAEIGLSAAQVATIRATFEDTMRIAPATWTRPTIDAHLKRLGAFRDDAFDARTLAGGAAANAHLAARGATPHGALLRGGRAGAHRRSARASSSSCSASTQPTRTTTVAARRTEDTHARHHHDVRKLATVGSLALTACSARPVATAGSTATPRTTPPTGSWPRRIPSTTTGKPPTSTAVSGTTGAAVAGAITAPSRAISAQYRGAHPGSSRAGEPRRRERRRREAEEAPGAEGTGAVAEEDRAMMRSTRLTARF